MRGWLVAALAAVGLLGCAPTAQYRKEGATRLETVEAAEVCNHRSKMAALQVMKNEAKYPTKADAQKAAAAAMQAAGEKCIRERGYRKVT